MAVGLADIPNPHGLSCGYWLRSLGKILTSVFFPRRVNRYSSIFYPGFRKLSQWRSFLIGLNKRLCHGGELHIIPTRKRLPSCGFQCRFAETKCKLYSVSLRCQAKDFAESDCRLVWIQNRYFQGSVRVEPHQKIRSVRRKDLRSVGI